MFESKSHAVRRADEARLLERVHLRRVGREEHVGGRAGLDLPREIARGAEVEDALLVRPLLSAADLLHRVGEARGGEDGYLLPLAAGQLRAASPVPRPERQHAGPRPVARRRDDEKAGSDTRGTLARMLTSANSNDPPAAAGRPAPRACRSTTTTSTTSAACSASSATRRPPTSPTSACTRCSTAGRSRPASSPADGERAAHREGHGPRRRRLHRRPASSRSPGDRRHRPRALLDRRRHRRPPNAQPFLIDCHRGPLALGHNGNLVNAAILRQRARGGRLDLPDHLRHRGDPAPLRAQPPRAARGRDRRQPVQGEGRLLAAVPHARGASSRRATPGASGRWCSAGSTAPRSSPPRPARST